MEELRYPLGIQTFSRIIEGGYAYVDKSMFIPPLIKAATFIFLSRPRRFGKSLTLSMLHSFFNCERELFKGLAIEEMDVEWVKRPVLHFDFNAEDYLRPDGLELIINRYLSKYEKIYGITDIDNSLSGRFAKLIEIAELAEGQQPAILVDEYDKPLLGIEDKPELFEKNQSILKGFFGVLKSMERHIFFAMLTGVARFNKVSIFSDLNNLRDISLENEFADICGWTQEELEKNYGPGIKKLADRHSISFEETIDRLRHFYDGYKFAPYGSRLYNPFSVLNALAKVEFGKYWFQTGTPTFLAKRIMKNKLLLPSLNSQWVEQTELEAVGMNDNNPIPLLFQTGYLTIKDSDGYEMELHFPNEEVETGFAQQLTKLYLPELADLNGVFGLRKFRLDLRAGKIEDFMLRLQTMIKDIPYEKHDEQLYQNVIYLLFTLLGTDARMEEHSNKGRTDLTIRMKDYIYIFEFKYNRSSAEAMNQIHDRDYAGRFAMTEKTIFLIGANFSKEERGLKDWIIERVDR